MLICKDIKQLRQQTACWRKNDERIAFVPTMGNLHAGHLSLVEIAQQKAARVVVSIYVNPLQFSPDEDFSSYPRSLEDDLEQLKNMAVDLVFLPDSEMIYPQGELQSSYVDVPQLSDIIEGQFRPGFFKGVATVVLKLFNLVQPDIAVFGEKDFQQLLVIRQMVKDLNLPVEIIAGATKREANGLAMSSRNNYLSAEERSHAQTLYQALLHYRQQIEQGEDIKKAQSDCVKTLENHGFNIDYVTLRETTMLSEVAVLVSDKPVERVILAAVLLGKTRLIDNVTFVI
jgi:pantoate--beta-alanine ligase